jgi:ATP-binding cassette subfamily B protein
LGLYTPTHGTISFDGIHITDFHPADFRNQVTAVFQDFMRFQFSVRENIGFGNLACLHDDAYIQVAASRTGADEVARTLSKGYDTVLGYMFEGAEDLSYGQWQKIALARAVNRNAQLILLDEPTSAMDPMAEAEMLEHFIRVMEGKTTILISHRLGICKSVDRIIVLQNGEVIEQGSHVELMAEKGVYSEMYETQAKWYEN